MKHLAAIALIAMLPALAQAQGPEPPFIKLPEKNSGRPGLIIVRADTNCTNLAWLCTDPAMQAFPSEFSKDSRIGVFIALTPGNYTAFVVGTTATGQLTSFIAFTINVEGNVPPPPDKQVAVPSVTGMQFELASQTIRQGQLSVGNVTRQQSTTQDIVLSQSPAAGSRVVAGSLIDLVVSVKGDPEPNDPLWPALKAAWQGELIGKDKLPSLVALYRQAAAAAQDQTVTTLGQLFDAIQTARMQLVGSALPGVRAAVGAELNRTLGTAAGTKMDAAVRSQAAAQFNRIASLLELLK